MRIYDVSVRCEKGTRDFRILGPDLVNVIGQLAVALDGVSDANDLLINIRIAVDTDEDC
jgi:hypothetical protein